MSASLPTNHSGIRISDAAMNTYLIDGFVSIRRFTLEDLLGLFTATLESIDNLRRWMKWCHRDYCIEDCRSFLCQTIVDWEDGKGYNFAIIDAHNKHLVGSIALNGVNRETNSANVGYWVRRSREGRGFGSGALRLITQFGFCDAGFNRLEIIIPQGNISSQRVAQKAGAHFEGVLRQKLLIDGAPHDVLIYSLIESAWGKYGNK